MINFSLFAFIVILILLAAPLRKRIPAPNGRLINLLFVAYLALLMVGAAVALVAAGAKTGLPYVGEGEGTDQPPYIYETVVDEGDPESVPEEKIAFEETFPFEGGELVLENPNGRGNDTMATVVIRRGIPGELTVTAYRTELLVDGYDLSAETGPEPPVLDRTRGTLLIGDYRPVNIASIDKSFLTVPLFKGGSSGSWSIQESPVYLLTVPEGVNVTTEGPVELTEIGE
ncbi:hypothetical protein ACFFIY_14200 [Bhargavaea ullalensis]|uniref:DUF4352 domain-containing protein n=1 Tax=Bhargavaea ullalensis TaxID=1265685 RepID=A0ABV2GF77_9BACL